MGDLLVGQWSKIENYSDTRVFNGIHVLAGYIVLRYNVIGIPTGSCTDRQMKDKLSLCQFLISR